jgi:hypothetical protein
MFIEKSALQDSTPVVVEPGSVVASLITVTDNANKAYEDYKAATTENTDVAIVNLRQQMLYINDIGETTPIPLDAGLLNGHPDSYFATANQLNSYSTMLQQAIKNVTVDSEVITARSSAVRGISYST